MTLGSCFERSLTVKGPATKTTAEDMANLLKTLFEAQGWKAKETKRGKLLVSGKKGSLIAEMEMRVEGLSEKYHPTIEWKLPAKTEK